MGGLARRVVQLVLMKVQRDARDALVGAAR